MKKFLFLLFLTCLTSQTVAQSDTTLNVTNFGAVGDCLHVYVKTTEDSNVITFTNILSSADEGKIIQLFK